MIEKLKDDNEQLKEELTLERRHAKAYDGVSAQAQIAKLLVAGLTLTTKDLNSVAQKPRGESLIRLKARINTKLFELVAVPRWQSHLDAGLVFSARLAGHD